MMNRPALALWGGLPALPIPVGLLIALALLILSGIVAVLCRRHYQRTRFTYRFGILWDKKRRPFCRICRTPLMNWSPHSGWKFERRQGRTVRLPTTFYAFDCPLCTKPVRLVDHDGYEVSLEDALDSFRDPGTGLDARSDGTPAAE